MTCYKARNKSATDLLYLTLFHRQIGRTAETQVNTEKAFYTYPHAKLTTFQDDDHANPTSSLYQSTDRHLYTDSLEI